jgi:hypothetical protein
LDGTKLLAHVLVRFNERGVSKLALKVAPGVRFEWLSAANMYTVKTGSSVTSDTPGDRPVTK